MAKVVPNVVSDGIYGVVNNAYTFDVLGRNQFGRPAELNNKSPRDSFFATIEQWAFSLPLKSQWMVYINNIPSFNNKYKQGTFDMREYIKNLDAFKYSLAMDGKRYYDFLSMIELFNNEGGMAGSTIPSDDSIWQAPINTSENILDKVKNRINQISNESFGQLIGRETSTTDYDKHFDGTNNIFGCKFADKISGLPKETLDYNYNEPGISGGFLGGYSSKGRSELSNLVIDFKETNQSITDFIIRPWIELLGYMGNIKTQGYPDLSTTIQVIEYARSTRTEEYNNSQMSGKAPPFVPRKHWIFYNCIPTEISEESLEYSSSDDWPVKKTTWKYTEYYCINYGKYNEIIKYVPPIGDSLLQRFIPGAVSSAVDSVLGSGTTSNIINMSPI